jgi:pimeloyl-ACP methyl ester carboxylesterase
VSAAFDYDESGRGPTIVFVPGSCSTGAAWRPVINRLQGRFRCVTTSLLGYGSTSERRSALDTDIGHEAELIEAVIARAGGAVHLVGHSFGGLAALAVALRRRAALQSLTILEAPAPDILRQMEEYTAYRAFREMTEVYFSLIQGGDQNAIALMVDFYGGAGTFASWPQRVRDYAIASTATNMLDWASAYNFRPTRAELMTIEIPTLVGWGENSHPAVTRANQLLAQCTRATPLCFAGASHFMISTHAEEVARALARHLAPVESPPLQALQFEPAALAAH